MTVAMVVPTIRQECISRLLEAWKPYPWAVTIVVEDNPERTFELPGVDAHYCWKDVDADFQGRRIFSRRDSGIKAYGFFKAVEEFGATHVLALDDDCYPYANASDFVRQHLDALSPPEWISTWPGLHVRGLPYGSHGQLAADKTLVNMGLWAEVPDLDAVGMLSSRRGGTPTVPPVSRRLKHPDQLFPLCGMNLFFAAAALPAMYFPKMGEGVPYTRFDDIWCGVVAQHVLHSLGHAFAVGQPFVRHAKASDAFVNLNKEAPGIAAHELFWPFVRSIQFPDSLPRTISAYIEHVAGEFITIGPSVLDKLPEPLNVSDSHARLADAQLAAYITDYGENLMTWQQRVDALAQR